MFDRWLASGVLRVRMIHLASMSFTCTAASYVRSGVRETPREMCVSQTGVQTKTYYMGQPSSCLDEDTKIVSFLYQMWGPPKKKACNVRFGLQK